MINNIDEILENNPNDLQDIFTFSENDEKMECDENYENFREMKFDEYYFKDDFNLDDDDEKRYLIVTGNYIRNEDFKIEDVEVNKNEKTNKKQKTHGSTYLKSDSKTDKYKDEKRKNNVNLNNKKKYLFYFNHKKKGRVPKESKQIIKGIHTKYSQDNIIRKIKVHFYKSLRNYLNKLYNIYQINELGSKETIKFIKQVSAAEKRKISKDENLKWFDMKIRDIFDVEISTKYKGENDYNKRLIKEIYEKNKAKKVIEVLEKTVREMYNIYTSLDKLEGFENLYEFLNKIRNEEDNDKNYLENFEDIGLNLEKKFEDKRKRDNNHKIKKKK